MSENKIDFEELKQEYLAQISGIFPLFRILLFFAVMIIVISAKTANNSSVMGSLMEWKLRSFLDFDKGYFSDVNVGDTLKVILFIVSGELLHWILRGFLFILIKKRLKLEKIVTIMYQKSKQHGAGTIESYFALKKSENEARTWGHTISTLSQWSKSSATLFLVCMYAGNFGSYIDYVIALCFMILSISLICQSLLIFLKNYLPHMIHVKGLLLLERKVNLP